MWYYICKVVVSALIIVAISEVAKRNSGFAALVASLPLTSLLAIIWLRFEGAELTQIAGLSQQIFWLVLPSLVLFLLLPLLLRYGMTFWLSLGLASAATVACYFLMILLLRRFGVSI
jgi:hypothetical protein